MAIAETLITEYLDTWSSAIKAKSSAGRGSGKNQEFYGIKKLRELILDLAVRGLLVPQDPNDEPASELLKQIDTDKSHLVKAGIIKKPKAQPAVESAEAPFELPMGWVFIRNGSLFGLRKGKVPKDLSESDGAIPYLDIEALDRGNVCRYTNDEKAPRSTDKDILVVCDGSRSGLVLDGQNGAIGSTLSVIETPTFIQDFVKLIFRQSYQRLNSTMKGAAIPHLDTKNLLIEITGLPPLAEQRRIVAKVDELMALCDQLEQQQENSLHAHQTLVQTLIGALTAASDPDRFSEAWKRIESNFDTLFTTESSIDELKQTILQLAVMGKLVPQDPNDEPAEEVLARIAETKLRLQKTGEIGKEKPVEPLQTDSLPFEAPDSWIWAKLAELTELITKGSSPKWQGIAYVPESEGILFITSENVGNYVLRKLDDLKHVSKGFNEIEPRSILKRGDILMNLVGASIGRTAVYDLHDGANINQAVALIRLVRETDGVCPRFLLHYLNSPFAIDYMLSSRVVNAQPNISLTDAREFAVPFPPLAEQRRIVTKVDELMALCDRLKAGLQTAQTTQLHLADTLIETAIK